MTTEIKRFVIGERGGQTFGGEVENTDGPRLEIGAFGRELKPEEGLSLNKSSVLWSVDSLDNYKYILDVLASRDWAIERLKAQALTECNDIAKSDKGEWD